MINRGQIHLLIISIILVSSAGTGFSAEVDTKIGILHPEIVGGGKDLRDKAERYLVKSFSEMGAYKVFSPSDLDKGFGAVEQEVPDNCNDPKCAAAVGSALQLYRMVYWRVIVSGESYAVSIKMVDVSTRQIYDDVELESEPGVSLEELIDICVKMLHGQVEKNVNKKTHMYYGRQVDNKKEMLITSSAVVGLGLVWGLVNRETPDDNSRIADYNIDYSGLGEEDLSGIGTGADLIPLFGRPGAMANCYTAKSDDAYGIFFNPAGLSWVSGREASLGYQYRFGLNTFAGSYVNKATRELGFGHGIIYNRDSLYSEVYVVSGMSYKFNELISFLRPFSVGANLKMIGKRTENSVSENSITGGAMGLGLDLGFMWEISEKIRYGFNFKNVPTFVFYSNESTDKSYTESEACEWYMGGSFQVSHGTILLAEGRIPLYSDQELRFAGGIETTVFRVLKLRLGVEKTEPHYESPWKFTGGFGVDFKTGAFPSKRFALDASYEYNTISTMAHVVNVSLRVGF